MFGTNPLRGKDYRPDGELWVQEIFPTIQGEGPYAGQSAIFVRLAGCNLRCYFCDTDFETGTEHLSPDSVMLSVMQKSPLVPMSNLIVLTGGEPLRQNVLPFANLATDEGFTVQVETAGTIWPPGLEKRCKDRSVEIVCSPKTPGIHPEIERYCWDYKYIIAASMRLDPDDGLPLSSTQQKGPGDIYRLYRPANDAATIWLQPMAEYHPTTNFTDPEQCQKNIELCAALAMKHGYRVSLQQHRILNLP